MSAERSWTSSTTTWLRPARPASPCSRRSRTPARAPRRSPHAAGAPAGRGRAMGQCAGAAGGRSAGTTARAGRGRQVGADDRQRRDARRWCSTGGGWPRWRACPGARSSPRCRPRPRRAPAGARCDTCERAACCSCGRAVVPVQQGPHPARQHAADHRPLMQQALSVRSAVARSGPAITAARRRSRHGAQMGAHTCATRDATPTAEMRRGCVQTMLHSAPRPARMAASRRNCGTCAPAHSGRPGCAVPEPPCTHPPQAVRVGRVRRPFNQLLRLCATCASQEQHAI